MDNKDFSTEDPRRKLIEMNLGLSLLVPNAVYGQYVSATYFSKVAVISNRIFSLLGSFDVNSGDIVSEWSESEFKNIEEEYNIIVSDVDKYSKSISLSSTVMTVLDKAIEVSKSIYIPEIKKEELSEYE